MALRANLVIVRDGFLPAGNVVRIMASCASKLVFALQPALQKALRFPQPVSSVGDFKAGVLPWCTIEIHLEVRQRSTRDIRERTAIQSDDGVRQLLVRGFQVALQANLDLAIRIQARRIRDCGSDDFRRIAS